MQLRSQTLEALYNFVPEEADELGLSAGKTLAQNLASPPTPTPTPTPALALPLSRYIQAVRMERHLAVAALVGAGIDVLHTDATALLP